MAAVVCNVATLGHHGNRLMSIVPNYKHEKTRQLLSFSMYLLIGLQSGDRLRNFGSIASPIRGAKLYRLPVYPNRNSISRRKVESPQQCRSISFEDGQNYYKIKNEEKNEESISRATLIWRAIKLPIYSVALVPLTVGSAVGYLQTGHFFARRYFMILASSIFVITWLNLSNDVYDFDTGADKNKKESVVNIVGMRTGTLVAACLLLAFGFTGLAWVSLASGNIRPLLLLACAIACGHVYQCPPFRLSYKGLGEPLCFAAFGPFATTAFYLLQNTSSELPISGTIFSASLLVGLTTTLILFCSHFHQVKEDIAVGKMSPLVRLGRETGSQVVKVAVISLYSLLLVFGVCRTLPLICVFVCALTFPMGKLVVDYVEENKDNSKIFMAKYYCVRLHTLFGAALSAGLVASRILKG